jgi:methionine synthase II (cobalamin-independent)
MKNFAVAVLILAMTTTVHAMSVMTNATGPYNYTCDEFAKAKPRERELALAFAQGYFAALNMCFGVE